MSDFAGTGKTPPPPPPPEAVRLAFASQPSNADAGTPVSTDLRVAIQDSTGATVTSAGSSVTATLVGGKPGAHLRGTTTVTASGGIATFTNLSVDSAGSNYTIAVSASGLASANSASFDVRAGPPVKLAFITQPTNTVAFAKITPAVRVAMIDSLGNRTDGPSLTILVTLQPSSSLLSGDRTKNTSSGVATFSDLRVTRTGSGFVLVASAGGFPDATSEAFSINEPTDVMALAVRVQPTDAAAGRFISPAIRVAAVNALGNTVTTSNAAISLALVSNSGTLGATLHGTTTVTAVNGEATFADISIDSVGNSYQLSATAAALTPDTTARFNITPGTTARLAFTVQPPNTVSGAAFNPAPQVTILDAQGNRVTGATNTVALYITAGSGTPGATLGGTTTVSAVGGVATFTGVSVSTAGSGYTLTAAAPGLASDVSSAFTVTAAGPAPAASVTVSPNTLSFASLGTVQPLTADVRDAQGQPTAAPVTWTTSNAAVATVDGAGRVTSKGNGTATITATSGTASGSAAIDVQQVTASVVILGSSPDTLAALGATGTFAAQARDANAQPIAGKTFNWTSDAAAVATIDAATGVATAVTNGTSAIHASVDGFTGTQTLVVWQAIANITVTPNTATLAAGQSVSVQAAAVDSRNNPIARAVTFAWTSSRNEVDVAADAGDSSKATITRTTGTHDVDVTVAAEGKAAIVRVH